MTYNEKSETMIEELEVVCEYLTSWEYDFICHIKYQENELTEKQKDTLEEIYKQYCQITREDQ